VALNIRNAEAERLAEAVAKITGETKTEAVTRALRDRLTRLRKERTHRSLADDIDDIGRHCAALAVKDARPADEILGYDTNGTPG
jgi:antitoxin VapB